MGFSAQAAKNPLAHLKTLNHNQIFGDVNVGTLSTADGLEVELVSPSRKIAEIHGRTIRRGRLAGEIALSLLVPNLIARGPGYRSP